MDSGASRDDYVHIYIDAAVMWTLEPLGMTMYIYIYIDAAVMWTLGMTMYIYIYILMLL